MSTTEPKRRSISPGQTALTFTPSVSADESVRLAPSFAATVNGLIVTGDPAFNAWQLPGKKLRVMERGSQFAIGDYANQLEERFGELAAQILDASEGWNLKTLNVYRWVASRIALGDRRMDRLGIKHHVLVAALTPAKQRGWLTRAACDDEAKPWTTARLAAALREGEDLPPSDWYVLVGPLSSGQVQDELMERLEAESLGVRAVTRRQRQAAQPDAAPALPPSQE